MSSVKDFFKNIMGNRKFRDAGAARKLNESSERKRETQSPRTIQPTASRSRISEGAERAAAAALARSEQKAQTNLNWSSQAIKNQAKKELEQESSMKTKPATHTGKVTEIKEECPNFTVSGVYFSCPLVGPDILPKHEMQERIKSFLYEQLEEERGLTACLIIRTLNKNKSKVELGIETITRYLANIISEPSEEKYRKIRIKNKVFQDRVADLEGAFDFLHDAGFSHQTLVVDDKEEEYLILQDENLDLEKLQMLKEALLSCEAICPKLDRNLKVLKPSQIVETVNLPDDFFSLTLGEVKKEQETRTENVELLTQLRTKAMREKDSVKERYMYKYCLVRIRFPDGIILQGTFSVHEAFASVKNFVSENLDVKNEEFELLLPGGVKPTDDSHSLLEMKLIPATILNFRFVNDFVPENFLISECRALLSDL